MAQKNEKTKIILGIGVIVGIIVLSYIVFPSSYKRIPTPSENLESPENSYFNPENLQGLKIVSGIIEQEANTYIINVKYPILEGLDNKERQTDLNKKIKDFIDVPISDFKSEIEQVEIFEEMKNGFYIDSEVTYLSKELISIKFLVSQYNSGAAHPNNYILTFNYDILEDKKIVIEDLFLDESDYLKALSDIAKSILFNRFQDDIGIMQEWIERGTESEEENFEDFGIKKNNLIIYFKPYQVGPYAVGAQEVEIPFEDLDEHINL